MQIFRKYLDLGSMLQSGYYAVYMLYAAIWKFFVKKLFLIFFNIKILLNYTVYQLSDIQYFLLICNKYAAYMLQN